MATSSSTPRTPAPPARRISLSEVLELVLTRKGGDTSSVTLTRNARGETQIEVKVRAGDDETITTAVEASHRARSIYDDLRAAYPMANGQTTGGAA